MPVPVPSKVRLVAEVEVVFPGGLGLPMSVQVHGDGHGLAGAWGVRVVVTGAPMAMLANEAVPALLPLFESTARPWRTVAGMSMSAVEPGMRV
jgi:hypothetical protein